MNANVKKGLIMIGFAVIGITIISFILQYILSIIGLGGIIRVSLRFLLLIFQISLIITGLLQMFGKFNIDKFYNLNNFIGNDITELNYSDNEIILDKKDTNLNTDEQIKSNINTLNLNGMEYKIEQVGAEFSNRAIKGLESRFNSYANEGYKFHSVFQVQKPGCLGIGSPSITYLAVYVKE
ncbi:hypothetical protein [Mariniflexile maritimum]|uniref:hypothetical protein n=1 Tax=Mariniflexile maritimum TaxID=2682493 RepID=UPI0018DCDB79|nr:hypothetical protein [Mariniflexile maritimum]